VKNKPESGGMITTRIEKALRGKPYTEYTYKQSNKKPSAQQPNEKKQDHQIVIQKHYSILYIQII